MLLSTRFSRTGEIVHRQEIGFLRFPRSATPQPDTARPHVKTVVVAALSSAEGTKIYSLVHFPLSLCVYLCISVSPYPGRLFPRAFRETSPAKRAQHRSAEPNKETSRIILTSSIYCWGRTRERDQLAERDTPFLFLWLPIRRSFAIANVHAPPAVDLGGLGTVGNVQEADSRMCTPVSQMSPMSLFHLQLVTITSINASSSSKSPGTD